MTALARLIACLPTGIRPLACYRRRGAPRIEHEGRDLSALPTAQILSMAKGVRLHSARTWTTRDSAIMAELEARCWTWSEAQYGRGLSFPMWLMRPSIKPADRFVLAYILAAYRHGSTGFLVSYEEAVALGCATSRTTWWRMLRRLEEAGFIVRVDTWREADPERSRNRERSRNLYQPGPALFELAGGEAGMLEGLHEREDGRDYDERKAERQRRALAGAQARRDARIERKAKLAAVWKSQRGQEPDKWDERLEAEATEPRIAHVSPEGAEFFELEGDAPAELEPTPEQAEANRLEAREAVREALAVLEQPDEPAAEQPEASPPPPGGAFAELCRLAGRRELADPAPLELEPSPGSSRMDARRARAAAPNPRFKVKPQTSRGGDSISERELQPATAPPPAGGGPRAILEEPGEGSSSRGAGSASSPVGPLTRSKARASVRDLGAVRLLRDALRGLSSADVEAFRAELARFERSERRTLDAAGRARFAVAWRARLVASRRPPG